MPRRNHSPERTCLGCHQRDQKSRMTRIVARAGVVTIDSAGSARGRGGYLHPEIRCLEKFVASKVKEFRSLKSGIDRGQRLRIIEAVRATTALDSEQRLE